MKITKEPNFNEVTNEWLLSQLDKSGLTKEDFAIRINVEPSQVYNWISGERNPSRPTKALFFYFFKYYKLKK